MRHFQKISLTLLLTSCAIIGTSPSTAADSQSGFECTLTDQVSANDVPGGAKESFSQTTPTIYLICDSDKVSKGEQVKATWIAVDTHDVAPANYKIDEKSLTVDKDITNDQTYTANLSLSKPDKGWPAGTYRVDLYVNDKLDKSVPFNVK